MAPLLYNSFPDGPAIVLPSQHPPNSFSTTTPSNIHHPADPLPFSANNLPYDPPLSSTTSPWKSASAFTPFRSKPSRKRSRDEYAIDDNSADDPSPSVLPAAPSSNLAVQAPKTKQEPVYGEGMVLLNPQTGLALSAESQTGTWFEETAESAAAAAPPTSKPTVPADQTNLRSRKSQRLDTTASGYDDITAASIQSKLHSSANDDTHRAAKAPLSHNSATEPQVDDFTHLLGISWQRVPISDEDMAAAVRGWEKYIGIHFSQYLCEPQILLKHRGLNAYLVSAQPPKNIDSLSFPSTLLANGNHPLQANNGLWNNQAQPQQTLFYLFKEDLTECQLVGKDWDSCLQNLRSSPIAYEDGSNVLRAAERSPERVVEDKGVLVESVSGNGNGMATGGDVEMGMDVDL